MPKVDNSAPAAKIALRAWLVDQIQPARVLDCFAGTGQMWRGAYQRTEFYLGLDRKVAPTDARRLIACDSLRYLRDRDVDIARFNLFDLDAYGSPYQHLAIICSRLRAKSAVGFVLTSGLGFNAAMNSMETKLLEYVGLEAHRVGRTQHMLREEIESRAIQRALGEAGLKIVEARRAEARKSSVMIMRYTALLCAPVAARAGTPARGAPRAIRSGRRRGSAVPG